MKPNVLLRGATSLAAAVLFVGALSACSGLVKGDARSQQPLSSQVTARLAAMGSSPGAAMMVRIYKQDSQLEIWKQVADGSFRLFKTYDICTFSGDLGPKIREGDRQSPEGFYTISRGLMNPNSNYYLSFNLGFPNKFDRAYGRTGSHLMVHGDCSSRGCYAMTDEQIAEIYALARETFTGGNRSFQVQIYPFRMTPQNLARYYDNPNIAYWQNLKEGFDYTEVTGKPARWDVCGRKYVFNARAASGQPLDATAACPPLVRDPEVVARVKALEEKDNQAYQVAVAEVQSDQQKAAEAAARRAQEEADAAERKRLNQIAVAEREKALGDAVNGFFSSIFGGGKAPDTAPVDGQGPVINSSLVAPIPHARISRS